MHLGISLDWYCLSYGIKCQALRLVKTLILIIFFTILTLLSLPSNVHAQELPLQFEQITVDHGLSQSAIYCILQDSQGFMWFGTQDGLNRYDGYNFKVYKYDELDPHSLSNNWITSIYEDRLGSIWVGTDGGGLNKFNRQTEQFTRYINETNNPNSLGSNRVLSVYEDQTGTIWVGTDGGGLNQLNRQTEKFTRYTYNPYKPNSLGNDTVLSIYQDKLGTLWIGTGGGGLNQFNHQTRQFTRYTNKPNEPTSLNANTVLSIYEDQSGRLWIGTKGGGLNLFDRKNRRFTHYTHDPDNPDSLSSNTVSSIVEDRFGDLWLGTSNWTVTSYGTALDNFDPQTGKFTHYTEDATQPKSLNDTVFNSLFRDPSDILWIGTAFGGINKLDQKDRKFITYKQDPTNPDSLNDNHVMSIYEDRSGIIWIGTDGGGLNRFDRPTHEFKHYKHDPNDSYSLSNDNVWSIYEDSKGTLWVGTFGGGLNKFDRQTKKFTHYTYNPQDSTSLNARTVSSIYEDSKGTLWIGTFNGGLNKFDPQTGKFYHYLYNSKNPKSLSDNDILNIYEDKSGTLWIGTLNGGFNKFNPQTGEFTQYKHDSNNPNSLSYNRILSMQEYPAGTLWLGTYGGGLDKFDIATETFTHYTHKDGLPNNSVAGILADDEGNLWLSTGKGLSKFNPTTASFRNYDVSDGLQGNEFDGVKAYVRSKKGEMFFGGLKGFNAFYPKLVKDNAHIPSIAITNFKVFDKAGKLDTDISQTKEIKLSYKDNFFSLEFAALDYTDPAKNQYAYKLEGFDKDWIYSGTRRYASYTNLDGGTYLFRVKGSNNDGVWNEEGTTLKILITPPPWKTWWAYTLYFIATFSAILCYIKWQARVQARENALTKEREMNKLRSEFMALVSHEFRTPLTTILSSAQILDRYGNKLSHEKQHNHHHRIQSAVGRMTQLLDDVLIVNQAELGKLKFTPEAIDLVAFCSDLVETFQTNAPQYSIGFTSKGNCTTAQMDEKLLRHIFTNLLSNAIKYSPSGSHIRFDLVCTTKEAVFYIQDRGIGIPDEDIKHLFSPFQRASNVGTIQGTGLGLTIVKNSVDLHQGKIFVDSILGIGTKFTVTLPLKIEHSP
ncbi:MAG TPA: histidine kinase [Cyanobacteria bacterium UBA8803]|nr:histidine kinase [Cyanobacteria bacterium UBA9273]HBL58243.1 histidine kinase [Cyanobacteria bacterium UBA8803]